MGPSMNVITRDGIIGRVSKAANTVGRQWLVVDTGFWVFSRKHLLPVGAVTRVDHDDGSVTMALTRGQIRTAPCYVKNEQVPNAG